MPDPLERLPADAGAYVLVIASATALPLDMPAFLGRRLQPGTYAYCGSAHGAGGLRARIARHVRKGKTMRWHVDRLTEAARIESIALRVGGRECDLVAELLAAGATAPVPGFGSSDCRICPAHLLALPAGTEALPLARTMSLGRGEFGPL